MNMIKHFLTEGDNETYCLVKLLAFVSIAMALYLVYFQVVIKGEKFDLSDFGMGMGAIFASVGAALKLKPDALDAPIAPDNKPPPTFK